MAEAASMYRRVRRGSGGGGAGVLAGAPKCATDRRDGTAAQTARVERLLRHVEGVSPSSTTGSGMSMVHTAAGTGGGSPGVVPRPMTVAEVQALRAKGRAVLVIHGQVYDVSSFLTQHPGGAQVITSEGVDGTAGFEATNHSAKARKQLEKYHLGSLTGGQDAALSAAAGSTDGAFVMPGDVCAASADAASGGAGAGAGAGAGTGGAGMAPGLSSRFNGGKPLHMDEFPFPGPPGDVSELLSKYIENQTGLFNCWMDKYELQRGVCLVVLCQRHGVACSRYGPHYVFKTRKLRFLVVSEPIGFTIGGASTMLKPTELAARRRKRGGAIKQTFYDRLTALFGTGVLFVDADKWGARRDYLQASFSVGAIRSTMPVVLEEAEALVRRIAETPMGVPLDVKPEMFRTAFAIIVKAALGQGADKVLGDKVEPLRHAFDTLIEKCFVLEDARNDAEHIKALQSFCTAAIKMGSERYLSSESKVKEHNGLPVLESIIRAAAPALKPPAGGCPFAKPLPAPVPENPGRVYSGSPYSEKDVRGELQTLTFAGHETTSNTLCWVLHYLTCYPEVQRRVQLEIDALLGARADVSMAPREQTDDGVRLMLGMKGDVTGPPHASPSSNLVYEDIRLPYLNLVIRETMRLRSTVPIIVRVASHDMVIAGRLVPAGTGIVFNIQGMHKNPDIWERPLEFDPSRPWHSDAFRPFGAAPRDCLGRNFAQLELRVVLTLLLRKFTFTQPPTPVPIREAIRITRTSDSGIWAVPHERTSLPRVSPAVDVNTPPMPHASRWAGTPFAPSAWSRAAGTPAAPCPTVTGAGSTSHSMPPSGAALHPDGSTLWVRLASKTYVSPDTAVFRLALPAGAERLGLPVGQHVRLGFTTKNPETGEEEVVQRSYTPVVPDGKCPGFVDFLIKVYRAGTHPRYPSGGRVTQWLDSLPLGSLVRMQGPRGRCRYHGNGHISIDVPASDGSGSTPQRLQMDNLVMVAGGSGVTPMLQIIRAILDNPQDDTTCHLLFGNRTEEDILLREELDGLRMRESTRQKGCRLTVAYTVDTAKPGWSGDVGFITPHMMAKRLPHPTPRTLVLACGPPPMLSSVAPAARALGYAHYFAF